MLSGPRSLRRVSSSTCPRRPPRHQWLAADAKLSCYASASTPAPSIPFSLSLFGGLQTPPVPLPLRQPFPGINEWSETRSRRRRRRKRRRRRRRGAIRDVPTVPHCSSSRRGQRARRECSYVTRTSSRCMLLMLPPPRRPSLCVSCKSFRSSRTSHCSFPSPVRQLIWLYIYVIEPRVYLELTSNRPVVCPIYVNMTSGKGDGKSATDETAGVAAQENVSHRTQSSRQANKQQVRHRASVACASCRDRRIRCVVPKGESECVQCQKAGNECVIKNDDERRRYV